MVLEKVPTSPPIVSYSKSAFQTARLLLRVNRAVLR